jgi:CelD/BcsL family acetyltransferase involved in cellulose biosynthesis
MPLYLRHGRGPLGLRRLGFLGTGEAQCEEVCAEQMSLLVLPPHEPAATQMVWQAIGRLDWDQFELLDVHQGSPLLRAGAGLTGAQLIDRDQCPVADLSGGFESYLQRHSSRGRQQIRRLLREGERAGARLRILEGDELESGFQDLMTLHQARWKADGRPGAFSAPRFTEFHHRLALLWLPRGLALIARLSVDADPVAVVYGFLQGGKFDFYQSGVRMGALGPVRSPGRLAHLLLMRALADRGVVAYDFLRGSAGYKVQLATRSLPLMEIRAWRPSLRTMLHRSLRLLAGLRRSLFSAARWAARRDGWRRRRAGAGGRSCTRGRRSSR